MQLVPWPPTASPSDAVRDLAPLETALAGRGPAVCPTGERAESPAGAALVVGTSGSTGRPKLAILSAAAVRASGEATAERCGGHGRWLLALPPTHVAGLQVMCRSLLAGQAPMAMADGPFTPAAFAAATERLGAGRRYTSLVPTQLVRLLDGETGTAAAASYDGILVGGAALPRRLHDRALAAGLRVVLTYGMSETAGGCVYDGAPLPCARVRLDGDRILLGGAMVADGYLGRPELTAEHFSTDAEGTRWYRTDDLGRLDEDGRLTVLGRADDLITTGGLKVAPRVVEEALLEHVPGLRECVVVGVPDPHWGSLVSALLVGDPEGATVDEVRDLLRPHLPPEALPRRVGWAGAIPLRGPGKPDRQAVGRLLAGAP